MQPYTKVEDLTVSTEEYFEPAHDSPKRPSWDSSWTRARYVSWIFILEAKLLNNLNVRPPETWFSRLLFETDYWNFQGLIKFIFQIFPSSFIYLLVGVLDRFLDFHFIYKFSLNIRHGTFLGQGQDMCVEFFSLLYRLYYSCV